MKIIVCPYHEILLSRNMNTLLTFQKTWINLTDVLFIYFFKAGGITWFYLWGILEEVDRISKFYYLLIEFRCKCSGAGAGSKGLGGKQKPRTQGNTQECRGFSLPSTVYSHQNGNLWLSVLIAVHLWATGIWPVWASYTQTFF